MSTNQFTKPATAKVEDNILTIGGCKTTDLVKQYKTPLYVIDEESIRSVCREYQSAFKNYTDKNPNKKLFRPLYASKALCVGALAKIISGEGFGFDTVSMGEIYTLYKAGIDMKTVLFNGNNKTPEELELALKADIGRYSVDNFYEIELLSELTKKYNKKVDVLLRITPGIECHTHDYIKTGQIDSKFGFDLHQVDEAVEKILKNYEYMHIKGIHAHIGSQIFEDKCYYDEIEILVEEISRINKKFGLYLDEMNIGGGLGVKYTKTDKPPAISEIGNGIISKLEECIEKYGIEPPVIYIEPGRSVISTAGTTLYTIGSMKQVLNGTKYVSVDGGMADNPRPSMYQAQYEADIVTKMNDEKTEKVTIAGRFCESGDILIKDIMLPKIEFGDILCVYNTGAYNYSMASNYNSVEKPAMVLVNNSQSDMIINRETLDDLISKQVIPDRLKG